jgi:molybdopterin converting factor subunit 1
VVKILYFAWLKGKTGIGAEEVEPPADVVTVGDLVDWLKLRSAGHAAAFADMKAVRCAVNQDYARLDAPVHAGDEVAFFPPVTGG